MSEAVEKLKRFAALCTVRATSIARRSDQREHLARIVIEITREPGGDLCIEHRLVTSARLDNNMATLRDHEWRALLADLATMREGACRAVARAHLPDFADNLNVLRNAK